MMESSDCKAMHLQNAEQVVLVCSQGLKCPFSWEERHLHAHYPCADIILLVSTAGSCFESIMTQGSGFVSSSFKQTCRMGNNCGNYQLPHNCRIVISFELQTHAEVVHTPGELPQWAQCLHQEQAGNSEEWLCAVKMSAQNLAMGEVMGYLSACGQGEGGKALLAGLCQALTTDISGKERKSVKPSHTITGLRANSQCALIERLHGQAQSGCFLECAQNHFMTQVMDKTTGGDAVLGLLFTK